MAGIAVTQKLTRGEMKLFLQTTG